MSTAALPIPQQPISSSPEMDVSVVVSNLDIPWALDFAPDGRIFITERPGNVRIVKDGVLQPEPWIVIDAVRLGEAGLLGLAIDPAFTQNHYVYVAYTYRNYSGAMANRLAKLREDPAIGKGTADRILLDSITGASTHDGGRLKFGPDGKLYFTMGDTQNTASSQDITSLNGKILRINSDGTIPADNPFPESPVYSYGHRNPQGLAWQPGTGRLYATEHGPSARDEINFVEPGNNYGWPVVTGDETRGGMTSPIMHSDSSETWAPSGATFVTGGPWAGSMLFAGLRGQSLYRLTFDDRDSSKVVSFDRLFTGVYGRLRDVVQGPDGAIYILTNNRDGRGSPIPQDDRLLKLTLSQ